MKLLLILMTSLFAVSACSTMQGFGRDVEKTGEKIQEKAQK